MNTGNRMRHGLLAASLSALVPLAASAQDHATMAMPMGKSTPEHPAPAPARKNAAVVHRHAGAPSAAGVQRAPRRSRPLGEGATPGRRHAPARSDATPDAMGEMHGMHGMRGMEGMQSPTKVAPIGPLTPIPALTDADRAAAVPPAQGHPAHDNPIDSYVLLDRLEVSNGQARGQWLDGEAWFGTDLNRVWLRGEGERVEGRTEAADLEVLYGHGIATWWDVLAGVRQDFQPGSGQTFGALGVMGKAPYKYDLEATAYIGSAGQTAARIEAGYDTLFTNRLILQSHVEANLFGREDARRAIGSGLSTIEIGLRLRYEFTRRFAPYVGVVREQSFGNTAELRRAAGDDTDDIRFVAGLRTWF